MKVRKVMISEELVVERLATGYESILEIVEEGIPPTATLVGARADGELDGHRVLSLMFWDESFDELDLQELIHGDYPIQHITVRGLKDETD